MSETITSQNAQQFADDEIVDNFDAGPDDGVPMGLGGEKGKQSSPAGSTLESDLTSEPRPTHQEKQTPSGDDLPSDDASAGGEQKPVQAAAGDEGSETPEPKSVEEPEVPEYPAVLLQMAGFSTVEDAQKAGFKDPESLLAAIQWHGKTLAQPVKPSRSSYLETQHVETPPTKLPAETPPQGDGSAFVPFKPANPDTFDDELLKLLEAQNKHYAEQFAQQQRQHASQIDQLASRLKSRDEDDQQRQALQRVEQFDRAVQELGNAWEDEFGRGDGGNLFGRTDAASVAAAQARLDLFDAVSSIRRVNAEQGGTPMSLQQELQWALMQRYPEKFKQHLLRDSEAKAQSRRGVQASRPTARKTPLGTKTERLLSALQTKYPTVDFSQGDTEIGGEI